MNENEQLEQPQSLQLSNAARVCFALRQGSDDPAFRILMESIGTLMQREHDEWTEMLRQRDPFAADFLHHVISALEIGDNHSGITLPLYERVMDHIRWLQNETKGYARAQDLNDERFTLIRRAAGITEPVPSHPDQWENLATAIREKCKTDES